MQTDCTARLITKVFSAFNLQPIEFGGKVYEPKPLRVSPLLARGLGCPAQCGACCTLQGGEGFSLDYLPFERSPSYTLAERSIEVNGKGYVVYTEAGASSHCQHLNLHTGRCGIYAVRPFNCDFEIIRLKHFNDVTASNQVLTAAFGRAWRMTRITGEKGAMCEIQNCSQANADEAARKLLRLCQWMEYFEVPHKVVPAIQYLRNGDWASGKPLMIG